MQVDFFQKKCQSHSNKKLFGLRDEPHPNMDPAYLDEANGHKWIGVVVNEFLHEVNFTAIDHCITILKTDGLDEKRCDCMLNYDSTVIFIELKERGSKRNNWVLDAEEQLRTTISYFENSDQSDEYSIKKAYAANSEHPKFKSSQAQRMNKFLNDTGYVFRIENRIILD